MLVLSAVVVVLSVLCLGAVWYMLRRDPRPDVPERYHVPKVVAPATDDPEFNDHRGLV